MEELKFHLQAFEGPLDLLLNLITKNKLNIYDIPISLIFDQYMEHIEQLRRMDMDVAGEFIVMASELMLIKSRMLLPASPQEEDPRAPLTAALVEYKKIKLAAQYFAEQLQLYGGRMTKDESDIAPDTSLLPHRTDALTRAFSRIIARMNDNPDGMQSLNMRTMDDIVRRHIVPVRAKIIGIMKYLYKNGICDFETLMGLARSRSELIASFAALLELMRAQRVIMTEEYGEDESCPTLYFTLDRERRESYDNTAAVLGDEQ